MVNTYQISGMTCTGCQKKVEHLLSEVTGVNKVSIDLEKGEAKLTMDRPVSTATLQHAFQHYPKYKLSETLKSPSAVAEPDIKDQVKWFTTYKPILLIFFYLTGITLAIEWYYGSFSWMRWMNHFMAGFFLVFSFFKLLDLKGFADSYSTYDILAKNWKAWGYLYPFVELGLGLAYLVVYNPLLTNSISFLVMSISIIGVIQSVVKKKQIQCACLGAVFNLPMSTVTIIEDALMIGMSGVMLLLMI
jgi:copper chaperone CopZ